MFIHYDNALDNRHPPSTKHHETRARTNVSLPKQSARLNIAPKNINAFCAPNTARWQMYLQQTHGPGTMLFMQCSECKICLLYD